MEKKGNRLEGGITNELREELADLGTSLSGGVLQCHGRLRFAYSVRNWEAFLLAG